MLYMFTVIFTQQMDTEYETLKTGFQLWILASSFQKSFCIKKAFVHKIINSCLRMCLLFVSFNKHVHVLASLKRVYRINIA